MGRAIIALIDRELVSVFGETSDSQVPVFAAEADEELTRREAAVADREGRVGGEEHRLREWGERLRVWEDELQRREQQTEFVAKLAARSRATNSKIGRNERCPCGSGLKFKHCHGRPAGRGW
jgi:preprotein translocase subunit SecA